MLERFLEQRLAIMATLMNPAISKSQGGKLLNGCERSDAETKRAEEYVTTMNIMVTTTKALLEQNCPSADIVLPLHETLLKNFSPLDSDSAFVTDIKPSGKMRSLRSGTKTA